MAKKLEPGDLPPDLAGALLELASDAIFLADSDLNIIGVNGQACTLLGYSKPELVGRNVLSFIPEPYLLSVPDDKAPLRRGETFRDQHEMRRKDGTTLMVDVSVRQLPDGNILGIGRDVSERARADAELRRHKDFIEKLLQSSGDGIVAFDTNMIATLFNPAIERITGLKADQVLGRRVYDVFPFLLDVREDEDVNATLQGQRTETRGRTFTIPQSGREGRYEAYYSPLVDEGGTIIGAIGVIRDVTERYALEQRLLHAQKMETAGRLAGGIAHDFNNVLTVIIGEVALSLGSTWSDDKARQALRRIGESAERAASITRQLLAFSRRTLVSPSAFTLEELVDGLRPMLLHLVGEGVELNIVRGSASGTVRADRGQMEQVLANLIVNARDAMPNGGVLTIETRTQHLEASGKWRIGSIVPGEYAVMSVTDTGVGMTDDVKSKLFEPFFTTKPAGTGLGLCSCLGMLQGNGGDLAIESSLGNGTTVHVCLPQAATEPSSVDRRPPSIREEPRGNERLLLVEDEEAVRNVTAEMLRQLGYCVHQAEHAKAAIAFLENSSEPIDLVISDVVMPHMGGRELMEHIQSEHSRTRVLLMSGYMADSALRQRAESEGLPILVKPFTQSALALKVRAVLDGDNVD